MPSPPPTFLQLNAHLAAFLTISIVGIPLGPSLNASEIIFGTESVGALAALDPPPSRQSLSHLHRPELKRDFRAFDLRHI